MSHRLHQRICLVVFAMSAPALPVHAQPTSPNPLLSIRFHNGSTVQQAKLVDAVEMDTKLGKLTIPAVEIQRIDFGFRLSEEDAKKLDQALRDLSSEKYPTREAASKTLLALGKLAYPGLIESRKGGDLEMTRRIDAVLKDIMARVPAEHLHTRRTDIVRTSDSTVAGQIVSPTLRVQCEIFGDVKVPLWRLRDLRSLMPGGDITVAIDASKFGNKATWLETEFEVSLGTRIEITATGEINLDPTNTLGGNANARNVKPGGTTGLVSGESFIPGQLIGRIGADGPAFLIGNSLVLTPNREGKLFLRIVTIEHASNVRSEGSYKVRISAEPTAHTSAAPRLEAPGLPPLPAPTLK